MASGILGISLTALTAAQTGIRTTQQNIANVNTQGYHRQEVVFSPLAGNVTGRLVMGYGVDVSSVRGMYDRFLEAEIRLNEGMAEKNAAYLNYASQIDKLFGTANSSLDTALSNFFDATNELANDPTSNAVRQGMISAGNILSDRFNALFGKLDQVGAAINEELDVAATVINGYTARIAELNQQIGRVSATAANPPNELIDQRDQLISELNKMVSVTVQEEGNGSVSVFMGTGQALVVGTNSYQITTAPDPSDPTADILALEFNGVTIPLDASYFSGGKVGGLMAFREEILNPAKQQMEDWATEFVAAFNAIHSAGDDLNGTSGLNFFSYSGSGATLAIHSDIASPNNIAAAYVGGGVGDNRNALDLAALQSTKIPGLGNVTFSGAYSALVSDVGSRTSAAKTSLRTFETMTNQARESQQSISGVNLDEEAINLIRYQQQYQAASKAIQVASTLFDTILNAMR